MGGGGDEEMGNASDLLDASSRSLDNIICRDRYARGDGCGDGEIREVAKEIISKMDELLDGDEPELELSGASRAQCLSIKGRSLHFWGTKCKDKDKLRDALELLMKAVKLLPQDSAAWNAAGECLWTLGDVDGACECFESSASHAENAEAYRLHSMCARKLGGSTAAQKMEHLTKSMQLAKQALALNFQDGESWYVLGNAYLASFFAVSHQTKGQEDLENAVKAYNRAESIMRESGLMNPDVLYNRGQVHRWLEMYEKAAEDYRRAHARDPSLAADVEAARIERRVARVTDFARRKGKIKKKRFESAVSGLRSRLGADLPPARIATLAEGKNPSESIALTLLMPLNSDSDPPISFLAADASGDVCAISVYHIDASACASLKMQSKDAITVRSPHVRRAQNYPVLLQAFNPSQFLVNGAPLSSSKYYAHAALATNILSS